jgi:DnaK suppressor protein
LFPEEFAMKAQFVIDMKLQLEQRLSQLLSDVRPMSSGSDDSEATKFSDPLDAAVFLTGQDMFFQMLERRKSVVRKINKALARIQDGSFGICDECGRDIGMGRLRAKPHATTCIGCKSKAEQLQKAAGF